MSMETPSAFPQPDFDIGYHDPGMSLRDYFAAQALGAMSADLKFNQEYGAAMRDLAWKAYVIADAMLTERAKATAAP